MQLSETCSCGAGIMVSGSSVKMAMSVLDGWRDRHVCPPRPDEHRDNGAATAEQALDGGEPVLGFRGAT